MNHPRSKQQYIKRAIQHQQNANKMPPLQNQNDAALKSDYKTNDINKQI